jgi:hypothetical protein
LRLGSSNFVREAEKPTELITFSFFFQEKSDHKGLYSSDFDARLSNMDWLKDNWLLLLASALLLGALGSHPYSYYQILRWVVAIVAVIHAYKAHESGMMFWKWVLIGMAILFNPIAPVYLEKETWAVLDVLSATFLLAFLFLFASNKNRV